MSGVSEGLSIFLWDDNAGEVVQCCAVTLDAPSDSGETEGSSETGGSSGTSGSSETGGSGETGAGGETGEGGETIEGGETEQTGETEEEGGDVVEEDAMVAPPGFVYMPVLVPEGWLSAMGGEESLETW